MTGECKTKKDFNMTPIEGISTYIADADKAQAQRKCPLQVIGDKTHDFYETEFYKLHCQFMPCNGNSRGHCAECWKLLLDEKDGKPLTEKQFTVDTRAAECPLFFYASLNGRSNLPEIMKKGFMQTDVLNHKDKFCTERDARLCFNDPSECWAKLLLAKDIQR